VLFCAVLRYPALCCTFLNYFVSLYNALHCFTLRWKLCCSVIVLFS
jgi:hypothetical protein